MNIYFNINKRSNESYSFSEQHGRIESKQKWLYLINHICLPYKLENMRNLNSNNYEPLFLKLINEVLVNFSSLKCITDGTEKFNEIIRMFSKWSNVQQNIYLDGKVISNAINSLKQNEVLPIYLKAHNCCYIIKLTNDDKNVISAFQTSATNSQVMSNNTDLAGIYPLFSVYVENKEILHSKTFGDQLADLANQPTLYGTSKKAGVTLVEERDVTDPKSAFEWIPAVLMAPHSNVCVNDAKTVVKKIRDDIIYSGGEPFRRSGMWMAIKVVLQLRLYELYGENEGKIIYKTIMALVLNKICTELSKSVPTIDSDLQLQIIKKLARRLYKLDVLKKELKTEFDIDEVMNDCFVGIDSIKQSLEEKFRKIINNCRSVSAKLDMENIDLNHCNHKKIHSLISKIEDLRNVEYNGLNSIIKAPNCQSRKLGSDLLNTSYFNSYGSCLITELYDIENWVQSLNLEDFKEIENVNSTNLLNLLEQYHRSAKSFYRDDEVGNSRMFITCIKIVCLLDVLAVNKYPMLKEHKIGLDIKPLESLLMPFSTEMINCQKIKEYIDERNRVSQYDSLVDCDRIDGNTFGVRYASVNSEMEEIRRKILEEAEKLRQLKLEELKKDRERYYDLLRESERLSCEYDYRIDMFGERKGPFHSSSCSKCSLKKQAKDMSVNVYEWPLPSLTNLQNAVIFELQIPENISYLRDALHFLRTEIYGFELTNKKTLCSTWINYSEMSKYVLKKQRYVTLGSSTQLFVYTHHRSKHPTSPDSDFLPPNGYTVSYCSFRNANNVCSYAKTYKCKDLFLSKVKKPYDVLQWTVDGTQHTENQVLASQSKCPQNLTLKEFIRFGSFRAGHRLQMRNLLDCFETRSISFKSTAVYSLICQALWQIGPLNDYGEVRNDYVSNDFTYPSSHADFENSDYMDKLHSTLSKYLEMSSKCWTDHLILLNIITVVARAISLSPNGDIKMKMIQLILECRKVASDWIISVQNILNQCESSDSRKTKNIKEILFEINCFNILTYYVDKKDLEFVMHNDDDIVTWFNSMSYINDHKISFEYSFDLFQKKLFRQITLCLLNIETHFTLVLERGNRQALIKFVKVYWPDSKEGIIEEWKQYDPPAQQWYYTSFIRKSDNFKIVLQLAINGAFLVQSNPVGKLPSEIYSSDDFKSYFGTTDFEVKPSCLGEDTYSTKEKQISKNYSSYLTFHRKSWDKIIIIEKRHYNDGKQMEYQFVSSDIFKLFFPRNFVECYSHWLNRTENCIEFRSKCYSDSEKNDFVYFKLDLNTFKLYDTVMERYLIDIQSKTFHEIHNKITKRLELAHYVHVFTKESQILIELPRMGLSFEVDVQRNCVISRDYRGMKVSENQQINTLFGLEKGLLLCEDINQESMLQIKKQFLVPNGQLNISKSKIEDEDVYTKKYDRIRESSYYRHDSYNNKIVSKCEENNEHHYVDIEITETIRNPAYYIYDIDDYLKKLRAEETINGWLYLAWLHATTSHILPDPFLGIAGTEMALDLLQSGNCWSSKPLEDEAIFILNNIATLSPKRQYYPSHVKVMQKIEWPADIPSMAAHEAYQWVAEKLVSDSDRLSFAYNQQKRNNNLKERGNKNLSARAYYRIVDYYSNLGKVNTSFARIMGELNQIPVLVFDNSFNWSSSEIQNARIIAANNCSHNANFSLEKFLFDKYELKGTSSEGYTDSTLTEWLNITSDIRNKFLVLYNYSKDSNKTEHNAKQTLLLSLLAYKNVSMDVLLFLQRVSNHPSLFKDINPPKVTNYQTSSGYSYNKQQIIKILEEEFISEREFSECIQNKFESDSSYLLRKKELYKKIKAQEISNIESVSIAPLWPFKNEKDSVKINSKYLQQMPQKYSFFSYRDNINDKINTVLRVWSQNLELITFIKSVECVIRSLPKSNQSFIQNVQTSSKLCQSFLKPKHFVRYDFDVNKEEFENLVRLNIEKIYETGSFDESFKSNSLCHQFPFNSNSTDCELRNMFFGSLKESWEYHFKTNTDLSNVNDQFTSCKRNKASFRIQSLKINKLLEKEVRSKDKVTMSLYDCGMWPRIVPTTMLRLLINKVESNVFVSQYVKNIFGALAVLWSLEQRMTRCITYINSGKSSEVLLRKELYDNKPHQNWSPKDYPEWLILELELNIMIRAVQIDVANKMMNPPDKKNAVMQLNMGEGKTSVIIPLLVSSMANGEQLVRIVVLKSLFNMNYNTLMQKVGGVLNKRVYVFPCQRDIKFTPDNVRLIQSIYNECKQNKGVVISLPEYQLSFKLKGIEMCRNGENNELGRLLVETQQWLKTNVRDILDESDELLSVKYQLVYPVGNNTVVDGGELRWLVAQAVLSLARTHYSELKNEFGDPNIEYQENLDFPQAYPKFRLLDRKPYFTLCEKICLDVLKGLATEIKFLELRNEQIEKVKNFILQPEIDEECRKLVHETFPENSHSRIIIYILRGYFTYNLLYVILSKRWKVEYGVNFKRTDILQAVPYRAKDVPADRAQFAHPDMVILLTQLSYYYSGLSDSQLDQVFERLEKTTDPSSEYESWIKALPNNCAVHNSVKEYSGINLSDTNQKYEILYPMLRYHPKVVNFWLSEMMYPKEGKQFSSKLCTSAWDLCEVNPNPLTGFSGTNDSRFLLPLSTEYHEIPELKGTNGMILSYLLQPENRHYEYLKPECTGKDIINLISTQSSSLRLLLDVGALMLELTNEQVVLEWLKTRLDVEAGVYFDNYNNLMVIDRKNRKSLLEISPYKKQLDKCVIYLDESHTRGTDLKFPHGTIGAVTLGRGVTKDRLMQACMRLRMLGHGHSVRFYASFEVHQAILNQHTIDQQNSDKNVFDSKNVLSWALENTRKQTVDGFQYWAMQGLSYYRRHSIYNDFKINKQMSTYSGNTVEHDIFKLSQLYGGDRFEDLIVKIVNARSDIFYNSLKKGCIFVEEFKENCVKLNNILMRLLPNQKTFTQFLEDEQELEVEIEKEEEREIERPGPATPASNTVDKDLERLVKQGLFNKSTNTLLHLPSSLNKSSVKHLLQHVAWSSNLYASSDFCRTVQSINEADDFLRPPRWLCVHQSNDDTVVVLMSDFEANELKPHFKKSTSTLVTLMPRSREGQERILSFPSVDISSVEMEQLSLFSGSLYFNTDREQDAFCSFIGFCPSPRTDIQQTHFENGLIQSNGYVLRQNRDQVFQGSSYILSKFEKDPSELIFKLCELRNFRLVPKSAHCIRLIYSGRKVTLN